MKELVITEDGWLARLLGRAVLAVRLGDVAADAADEVGRALAGLLAEKQRQGPLFAYAKADARELAKTHLLERAGFRLIEASVGLERRGAAASWPDASVRCRPAVPADAAAVEALAGRCFRFSRFHLDAQLPPAAADRIKAAWAGNYFLGKRGDMLVVSEERGVVNGFLQVLLPGDGALVIDLIGVDASARGRGAGRSLIATACRLAGRDQARVGTQLVNAQALAFYQRLGFQIVSSAYVLHYHG